MEKIKPRGHDRRDLERVSPPPGAEKGYVCILLQHRRGGCGCKDEALR